jgi:hypothetical protein
VVQTATSAEARAGCPEYQPRSPQDTVLHKVVVSHLETFLEEARTADGGAGVPIFVERAFRKLVECGCLGRGFARVRCASCGFERLVPFSCKTRGLCPSCAGRRMMELSAHLVDAVIPKVPVRQWVLTLPYPVRYWIAWSHDRARELLAVFIEELQELYRTKAQERGIDDGRTGAVTVIQRCGSALNLNPHFHTLCLDGVFAREPDGTLGFHAVGTIRDEDVAEVLAKVRDRVLHLLEREGALDGHDASFQFDALSEESPALAGMYSAGVQGRVSMGQRAGRQVMRVGSAPDALWVVSRTPLQAHLEGFDLHAAVSVGAGDRERLERVCQYILRPPVVQDRLELLDDGRVLLELKTPFWDGTTHMVFEPLELIEKLAAIIPRPRINLLIYHGALGPNAAWRTEVVSFGRAGDVQSDTVLGAAKRRSYTWSELMARAFLIDVLDCPRCHGRMKLIALIEEPRVVRKILDHLGLPTDIPSPRPARSPPLGLDEETIFADP